MTTKLSAAQQKKLEAHETQIVESKKKARDLAIHVFGKDVPSEAIHEISSYIQKADVESVTRDLLTAYDKAKDVYETATPKSEDVLDLFFDLFVGDEDE